MKKRFLYRFVVIFLVMVNLLISVVYADLIRVNYSLIYDGRSVSYTNYEIGLFVNGNQITNLPLNPIIINDRLYVPVREVFENIGAIVEWDSEANEAIVGYNNNIIKLRKNSNYIDVNGYKAEMLEPTKIINDKLTVPIRFAAEALGFNVTWDDPGKNVILTELDTVIDENITNETIPDDNITPQDSTEMNLSESNAVIDINNQAVYQGEPAMDVSLDIITEESFPRTQITSISLPDSSTVDTYVINASSEITKVTKMLLPDNRLVIDIYNAEMKMNENLINVDDTYLKSVRCGQFEVTPEMITRVVFDIIQPVCYSVKLTADRKSVVMSFENNYITDVSFTTDGENDYINITGLNQPVVSIFPVSDPDRLVIDVPLGIMYKNLDEVTNGVYASSIRTGQFDDETARIVANLSQYCDYTIIRSDKTITIKLIEPTYKNVKYDADTRTLVIPKNLSYPIDINSIIHTDNYNMYQYTLTLPGDYSGLIGYGEYIIKDNYLQSINIDTTNNITTINISESQILAYTITEDSSYIYIKAVLPKEKYKKIVVIDPGHGGNDPGAQGFGLTEKNINLDVSLRVIALLEQHQDVKVYSTRTTDVYIDLEGRANFGNSLGDMFVSIHTNSNTSSSPHGTEVYYYSKTDNLYTNGKGKQLAQLFQNNLVNTIGFYDRKIKSAAFVVIKNSRIPAILCETGFISNKNDAAKIATDEFKNLAAYGIYQSILESFNSIIPIR